MFVVNLSLLYPYILHKMHFFTVQHWNAFVQQIQALLIKQQARNPSIMRVSGLPISTYGVTKSLNVIISRNGKFTERHDEPTSYVSSASCSVKFRNVLIVTQPTNCHSSGHNPPFRQYRSNPLILRGFWDVSPLPFHQFLWVYYKTKGYKKSLMP